MKYNKEYYDKMVSTMIFTLIHEKDELVEELGDVVTPIIDDRETSYELNKYDIERINTLRVKIATIYKLIDDVQSHFDNYVH